MRGAWPSPISWSAHCFFAGEGGFGYVTIAVSWQLPGYGIQFFSITQSFGYSSAMAGIGTL